MHVLRLMAACTFLAILVLFAACSKSPAPPVSESEAKTQLPPIDSSTTANISGVVSFEGAPPAAQPIDMSADPACKGDTSWQPVRVDKGRLANVVVYVKDGLNGRSFPPPAETVTIAQKGCEFQPHVAAVMAGQPVVFLDDDPTMHNIHPQPKNNKEWNQAEQSNGGTIKRTFEHYELMIPIKCNQHPWMRMYLNVFPHPYFAVTENDGSFSLKGLPPGTYTIAAVHEKLGERDQTITVEPKQDKRTVQFTF